MIDSSKVWTGDLNRMALEPTRTGVFWGACTEYCGTNHSEMQSVVVVHETMEDLAVWLKKVSARVADAVRCRAGQAAYDGAQHGRPPRGTRRRTPPGRLWERRSSGRASSKVRREYHVLSSASCAQSAKLKVPNWITGPGVIPGWRVSDEVEKFLDEPPLVK